jgi:hypothetical protein
MSKMNATVSLKSVVPPIPATARKWFFDIVQFHVKRNADRLVIDQKWVIVATRIWMLFDIRILQEAYATFKRDRPFSKLKQ